MTWADLFDRAEGYDADEQRVSDTLARRREDATDE
ncbi:hypothetical protein SAMN06269185_1551 [Natronoarchaeum philippinense]|uniref:Uncharacterized protein n=1 Tax=Natronoarchaeum philippinense TaxID=558529 RepID=A0A285NRX7_NATPI|nr:hypothetical protein SAMN06269185_1551 [Natronoarchaeum philippinense]